jgi:uncharacterized protein (DUF2062 family)
MPFALKNGFFYRKLVGPIFDLLRQGITPEKIALSVALGAAIGVFPALGTTTTLCAIVALVLRLNLPAIQIVNYFMYPVQVVLLLPFFRLGEKLFRAQHLPLSISRIYEMIHAGAWNAIKLLWTTTWHAIVVWALLAPSFVVLAYLSLIPLLRRAMPRQVLTAPESGQHV